MSTPTSGNPPLSSLSALGVKSKGNDDSDGKTDDHHTMMMKMMKRQQDLEGKIAALMANSLPSTIGITPSTGKSVIPSSSSSSSSLISAMRPSSAAKAPSKVSMSSSGAGVHVSAPTTPAATTTIQSSSSSSTIGSMSDNDDENKGSSIIIDDDDLADIGIDGNQDEPTTQERANVLSLRLATGQCEYVDNEYSGKFINWYKDNKWRSSLDREMKLLCRLADQTRIEIDNYESSELMEIICCRIASLSMINNGDGSAAADVIERKHRSSMVPDSIRLSAIKEGNLLAKAINKAKDGMKRDINSNGHNSNKRNGGNNSKRNNNNRSKNNYAGGPRVTSDKK